MNRRQVAHLSPADRLARKSEARPDGCTVWTGSVSGGGYGQLSVAGRYVLAHRLTWELLHGEIPVGMSVCHSCDNPICINPDHLWLGSPRDNTQDAIAKGHMWWQVAS